MDGRGKSNKLLSQARIREPADVTFGMLLRQYRLAAGLTQEELAQRLKTKKTAISRIENHAEDIKLSTLEKVAHALGKRLEVKIA